MATYHFQIKSGKKGSAVEHAKYIAREGKYSHHEDLVEEASGNLPSWAKGDPYEFWRKANKHERANGCVYREYIIAIPNELPPAQWDEFARTVVTRLVGSKPYHYAIHVREGNLEGIDNPHVHLMFSDRLPDGIERTPEQTFARYNSANPKQGGCKKDSGGMSPLALREDARAKRKAIADIQNELLAEIGSQERVDHRSHTERGLERQPERHLGPARVKRMTEVEREQYVSYRETNLAPSQSDGNLRTW